MSKTLDDLLDAAIHHEQLSQAMYRDAAAIVTDPEARLFLRSLVEEEEGHERMLLQMKKMEIYDGSIPLEDPSILDAGRGSHGASSPSELAPGASIDQVIDLALAREHRARSLFERLAATARHEDLKQLFVNLAAEEDSHHRDIEKRFRAQRGLMGDEN